MRELTSNMKGRCTHTLATQHQNEHSTAATSQKLRNAAAPWKTSGVLMSNGSCGLHSNNKAGPEHTSSSSSITQLLVQGARATVVAAAVAEVAAWDCCVDPHPPAASADCLVHPASLSQAPRSAATAAAALAAAVADQGLHAAAAAVGTAAVGTAAGDLHC